MQVGMYNNDVGVAGRGYVYTSWHHTLTTPYYLPTIQKQRVQATYETTNTFLSQECILLLVGTAINALDKMLDVPQTVAVCWYKQKIKVSFDTRYSDERSVPATSNIRHTAESLLRMPIIFNTCLQLEGECGILSMQRLSLLMFSFSHCWWSFSRQVHCTPSASACYFYHECCSSSNYCLYYQ